MEIVEDTNTVKKRRRVSLKLTKSFYYTFILLFSVIVFVFVLFAALTHFNSQNALKHELMSYSELQVQSIADTVDDHLRDMRYVMATLYTQSSSRYFLTKAEPNPITPNNNETLKNQIAAYQYSFNYLDSIYLYSAASDTMIDNDRVGTLLQFDDLNWMSRIEEAGQKDYLIFSRMKNGFFPYLLCLLKVMDTEYGYSAIALNINLTQMPPLSTYTDSSNEHIYIISDSGEIIYRYNQKEFLEPYTNVDILKHFDSSVDSKQLFLSDDRPLIYSQVHSEQYDWNYVLISDITNYTARLTSSQNLPILILFFAFLIAILMVFVIVLRATMPMASIIKLLDNPENFVEGETVSQEHKAIIQKIMHYIQTNTILSDALEKQLWQLHQAKLLALQSQINPHFLLNTLNTIRMLEIQSLGFTHPVPEMTLTLSRLLQYALEPGDSVPLDTEITYSKLFAKLMDRRYQGEIEFRFDVKSNTGNPIVPKLIIQPLIENAVFHGLSALTRPGRFVITTVTASEETKLCTICVQDNGLGMPPERLAELIQQVSNFNDNPNDSIGLHNVILRMHLLYGDQFTFQINSIENTGTAIQLQFPTTIYKRQK